MYFNLGVRAISAIKLGIAIKALTISESIQTVPVLSNAPTTTVRICNHTNFRQTPSPKRYWAQRMPYKPQPITVATAKAHNATVIKMPDQLP